MKDGWAEVLRETTLEIYEHPSTKNWILTFAALVKDDGNLDINVRLRFLELNSQNFEFTESGSKKFPDSDIVTYLYRKYYIEWLSVRDISADIWVPPKTISNWFLKYLWWTARPFIGTYTQRTKLKRREAMLGNKNGGWLRSRCSDKIQEILDSPSVLKYERPLFDYESYHSQHYWYHKIDMILEYAWYGEKYLPFLISDLWKDGFKPPIIATIINTLIAQIIVKLWLDIRVIPQINRVTIHNKLKKIENPFSNFSNLWNLENAVWS